MAYQNSGSRGGSSRGGSRGSYGSGGGGGGSRGARPSSNAVAYVVAIVIVLGVVGLVIGLSGGSKEKPKAPPVAAVPVPVLPSRPVGPKEKPYPEIPASKAQEAKQLVDSFETDAGKARTLYADSQKAHQAGNDSEWQKKLKEAKQLLSDINDKWNEFESTLPTGNGYDSDQVAAHYFSRERGRVQVLTKDLQAMKTDER